MHTNLQLKGFLIMRFKVLHTEMGLRIGNEHQHCYRAFPPDEINSNHLSFSTGAFPPGVSLSGPSTGNPCTPWREELQDNRAPRVSTTGKLSVYGTGTPLQVEVVDNCSLELGGGRVAAHVFCPHLGTG